MHLPRFPFVPADAASFAASARLHERAPAVARRSLYPVKAKGARLFDIRDLGCLTRFQSTAERPEAVAHAVESTRAAICIR